MARPQHLMSSGSLLEDPFLIWRKVRFDLIVRLSIFWMKSKLEWLVQSILGALLEDSYDGVHAKARFGVSI